MKALKDVSKIHLKRTSTRAPVAEPSLFISKKSKELTVLQPEHPSSLVLSQQVFEEEPLDYPHQGPRLDTTNPLDEDLGPIFDEEDEPGPVHPLRNKIIDRVQQPEIWRSFVVQTGYLGDASDRGSVRKGYLNIQKVFCHDVNFPGKPTHQIFTEAWNHLKIFTEEGVMNFINCRFSSPSIRKYQTSKGDSGPRKKRPEPKPILNEPKVFPQSTSCPNQNHCTMDLRTNPFEETQILLKREGMMCRNHARLDVDHARLKVDHARLDLDHARLDMDHARLDLDHEVSQNNRDFSLLARLAHTACTDDCADDLSTLFDQIMEFSFGNFSKARILELSEDLGFVGT
ncbi:hypothetical protein YC2023_107879 [Brassica napus]